MKNAAALLFVVCLASPVAGQSPDAGRGVRFGVTAGGISTMGLVVELFDDSRSVEVALGTWSFRDLSVAVVGKQYLGAGAARPYLGLGLWAVTARPPDGRRGLALAVRAPIGVDWAVDGRHALGGGLAVNRGLWVRRTDADDDLPLNRRLVPLPEVYYRFTR